MNTRPAIRPSLLRAAAVAVLGVGSLLWSGCSSVDMGRTALPLEQIAKYSPQAQVVSPTEAIDGAQAYVHAHPGADFSIGSGDSMLPLYHDRAVIVTERPALSDLHVGQTVVFMGADGVPVAHTLLRRSGDGWVTMGMNNSQPDEGILRDAAYMGVVVKAYQPTGSPILAYARTSHRNEYASNP